MTEHSRLTRNPYWVLGLSIQANSRDIRRRFGEMKIAIDLGLEPGVTEDDIRQARQALDDPTRRIVHQWFWFLRDEVPVEYAPLFPGAAFIGANASNLTPEPQDDALVQALIQHDAMAAGLIAMELNPSSVEDLNQLFRNAKSTGSAPRLWEFLASVSDAKDDPRIQRAIEIFRQTVNDEFVTRVLAALPPITLPDHRLKDLLTAIAESGASMKTVTTATSRLLDQREDVVIAAVQRFDQDWGALRLDALDESPLPPPRLPLQRLIVFSQEELLAHARSLQSVAPVKWQPELFDQVAQRLCALAFAALRVLEDPWVALDLCDAAKTVAATEQEQSDISNLRPTIERQAYWWGLNQALEAEDWPLAIANAEALRDLQNPDNAELAGLIQAISREHQIGPASVEEARLYLRQRILNPGVPLARNIGRQLRQSRRDDESKVRLHHQAPYCRPSPVRTCTPPANLAMDCGCRSGWRRATQCPGWQPRR
jgi:hypothetical protein